MLPGGQWGCALDRTAFAEITQFHSHIVGTEHRDTELASGVELRARRIIRMSDAEAQKEGKQVLSMNSAQTSGKSISSADSPRPQRTYILETPIKGKKKGSKY